MSETSASKLVASISGEATSPDTTDDTLEEVEGQEVDETEEDSTEETETTEDTEEVELPDAVKDILKKNRKAVREAEARAIAAEKALAAKDKGTEETSEEAPVDDKFKKLFINSAAKAALADAGLTTGTDRFLKMLDLSGVEVDESGAVSGLDDQIADLKEDFKDLFAPKATKKTVTKADVAGRREPVAAPKTSAERLAERISGR